MMIAVASLSLAGLARADALDDDIARELCGSKPSGGLDVPNCSISSEGKLAFAQAPQQAADEERPPAPTPRVKLAASEPVEVLGPDLEEALRWRSSVGTHDGAAPTCSAPCTEATPPTAWSDRSYMFDAEYAFGN